MAMANLNISLPESMRAFVESKIQRGGYGTISEYLRDLIREDERRETEYFDRLIAEAYASGAMVKHDKADIEAMRAESLRRIEMRRKSK